MDQICPVWSALSLLSSPLPLLRFSRFVHLLLHPPAPSVFAHPSTVSLPSRTQLQVRDATQSSTALPARPAPTKLDPGESMICQSRAVQSSAEQCRATIATMYKVETRSSGRLNRETDRVIRRSKSCGDRDGCWFQLGRSQLSLLVTRQLYS